MRKLKLQELNRKNVEEYKATSKLPVVLVLDNIRSLHNIGSVFRSADAFLVHKILLCGITSKPPHREIHKTALGSTESVAWEYYKDTADALKDLKQQGYKIFCAEQTDKSISLEDFSFVDKGPFALVFGNEVKGVDDEALLLCDESIEIQQFGTKHSLNVSVSAGIFLWKMNYELLLSEA